MEYDISVFECIWRLDGIKVILEPACRYYSLYDENNSFVEMLLASYIRLVLFLLVFV